MRKLLIIIFSSIILNSFSQEKAILYSHHTFNGLAINPAFAGSNEVMSVNISHREQWIGFEGAPSYSIVSAHSSFKNTPEGIGILVMNESMGLRKFTGIYLNYAHHLKMGNAKLALGLKGGIGMGKYEEVDLGDDVVFSENSRRYLLPNFGFGLYYYTKKYNIGFSIPLFFGYRTSETGEVIAYNDFANYTYYIKGGYNFDINSNWKLHPSVLINYSKKSGAIIDGGASVIYKDAIRFGTTYRTKQAIVLLFDYKINYQLRAGLAYDYGISGLNTYNRNSIEIAIEYNFSYKVKASNPTVF